MPKVIKSKPVNKDDSKSTVKKIPVNSINAQNISGGIDLKFGNIPKRKCQGCGTTYPYFTGAYDCGYCGECIKEKRKKDPFFGIAPWDVGGRQRAIKEFLRLHSDELAKPKKMSMDATNLQNISGGVKTLKDKKIKPLVSPKQEPYFPDIYQPCKCEYCGREFTNFARRDYHVAHEHTNTGKENKANTDTNNKFFI